MTDLGFYLQEDHSARRLTTAMCAAAGLLVGIAMGEAGLSTNLTALVCVLVTAAIEMIRAFTYKQSITNARLTNNVFRSSRRVWLEGTVAAGIIVVMSLLPFPTAEAAIVERRLKKALDSSPPDSRAIRKLIDFAVENRVVLNRGKLEDASRKLAATIAPSKPESNATSESVASIEGYVLYSTTDEKLNLGSTVVVCQAAEYPFYASVNMRSVSVLGVGRDQTRILALFTQSTRFPALFVDSPMMKADVLLAHMTAQGPKPLSDAPAFLAQNSGDHKFAVFDVSVMGLRQNLDRIIWADVVFENCWISYSGGILDLTNVRFRNCDFTADTREAEPAVAFIRGQGDKAITIHSATLG